MNKKTVLIVEDEASLRNALVEKITGADFEVFEANNGQDGLLLALEKHPDMILVDILMPVMDGLTMMKELREDDWGKTARFIVLTNINEVGQISKAMQLAEINKDDSFEYFIKTDIKIEDVVTSIKNKLNN